MRQFALSRCVRRLGLIAIPLALTGCGVNPSATGNNIIIAGPPPVTEAVYASDPATGSIFEAGVNQDGSLTGVQTTTGLAGVTQVTPSLDGTVLFAMQPGAITVLAIDLTVGTGTLSVQQTVPTAGIIDTPISATADSSGTFLLVAGTNGGTPTIVAFLLDSTDNLLTPTGITLTGLTGAPPAANGITAVSIGGTQEAAVVALQSTTNNVVAVGFDSASGAFVGPGTEQTVDNIGATGVTTSGGLVYACGQQLLDVFSVDGNGNLSIPSGGTGSVSVATQAVQNGINTSVSPGTPNGQNSIFVGYSSASDAVAQVPVNADGSLGTPTDFQAANALSAALGVDAISVDANQTLFTADAGAFVDSFVFSTLGLPSETPAISTGGVNPTSICNVVIFSP